MAHDMGNGVPLLNDYKQEFFWKRFPQTLLGGPKFRLGYDAPAYVYLNQILLFLLPWLLGGLFTILVEVGGLDYDVGIYVYGCCMFVVVVLVNTLASALRHRRAAVRPIVSNQQNMLAEEDEILFESCCGIETVNFVVPEKKYRLNILVHALLSGVTCGWGLWYLLPQTLNAVYSNNTAATACLYILGWLTLLIAQYSLTVSAPPEPATYQALDAYELMPLTRPLYLLIFFSFDLLARHYSYFMEANQVLHVVFVLLPVLWTLGVLPPIDALWFWLCEQIMVLLFGGSPMDSNLKLCVMLGLAGVSFVIMNFVPEGTGLAVMMAFLGYLLSLNWWSLLSQLCCQKRITTLQFPVGFLWRWGLLECVFHAGMILLVAGLTTALWVVREDTVLGDYAPYLAYACLGLWAIQVLLSQLQQVYVCGGLWRNKLYPSSAQRGTIFHKGKKKLNVLGVIRRIIVGAVAPVLMLVFLNVSVSFPSVTSASDSKQIMELLGIYRSYRWIWQGTCSSLLEIGVAGLLVDVLPADSSWHNLGLGIQLMVLALLHDRLRQLANKLYFVLAVSVTSWTDKKQRRKSTPTQLGVNVILFPFLLAIICVAVALSAPILPLFTLPVFLVGYPRLQRVWPGPVGQAANVCPDTVYYEQLAKQIAKAMRKAFASGSLGDADPGSHYVMRFQDRLAWVVVLERGYGYCTLSIKGLELQETSCHTVEATRLDDIFEITFEKENGVSFCDFNKYPLSALRPYDAAYVKTYSDARNVLTGVIDSPESLQLVSTAFTQTLVWVILKHVVKRRAERAQSGGVVLERPASARKPQLATVDDWNEVQDEKGSNINLRNNALERPPTAQSRPGTGRKSRSLSLGSFKSTWSDDNDSLIMEPLDNKKNRINLVTGFSNPQDISESRDSGLPTGSRSRKMSIPGQIDRSSSASDMEELFQDFGLPAVDINQQKQASKTGFTNYGATILAESINFDSVHSRLVSPPLQWREIPIEPAKLSCFADQFPVAWYQHVLSLLDVTSPTDMSRVSLLKEVCKDGALQKMYNQLCMACFGIVNVLGVNGSDPVSLGTHHVHKVYSGDIPWSPALEFLNENPELLKLVLQAYRYAVKLSIDQTLMGEASSFEELQEYLEEYDRDCYIGLDTDPEWNEAVRRHVPQLFSFGHNPVQGTYHSRVLSLQEQLVYMGSMNAEAVRGQWANLNLELFYLTNDDEERYSIQAHSTLMRNLTVQAADPPLGYPIYASPPATVPVL